MAGNLNLSIEPLANARFSLQMKKRNYYKYSNTANTDIGASEVVYFRGTFPEIKGISADNFEDKNLNSSVFFLSHVHTDHTVGLDQKPFLNKILEPDVYLYSSRISTKLLKKWHPDQAHKFIYIDELKMIEIPGQEEILTVIPIPAEHCPGSIMFLFMSKGKTILYTGDFRYEMNVLENYKKYFLDRNGKVRKIDKVYLDVTFFQKKYPQFPAREVVLDKICQIIMEWIEGNKDNKVIIKTPAYYGSESLYLGIWEKFQIPISVGDEVYGLLRNIPVLEKAVTLNKESQIEAIFMREIKTSPAPNCRSILPTAHFWVDWDGNTIADYNDVNHIRVCYSCHASYEEIVEFLRFLKPKSIEPNVLPKKEEDQELLFELIDEFIESYSEPSSQSECEEERQVKRKRI